MKLTAALINIAGVPTIVGEATAILIDEETGEEMLADLADEWTEGDWPFTNTTFQEVAAQLPGTVETMGEDYISVLSHANPLT